MHECTVKQQQQWLLTHNICIIICNQKPKVPEPKLQWSKSYSLNIISIIIIGVVHIQMLGVKCVIVLRSSGLKIVATCTQ